MRLIFEIGNEIEVEIENEFKIENEFEIEIENEFEIEIGNEFKIEIENEFEIEIGNEFKICSKPAKLSTKRTFFIIILAAMTIHGMHSRSMVPNCPRTDKNCAEKGQEREKERFLRTL